MTAPHVVVGSGIAGIAAAVELARRGERVLLLEKRNRLGGRASSFIDKDTGEEIDNCQHVVLGCCTNVLDLFAELGVGDGIEFFDEFHYVEPDGNRHTLSPTALPAPLHFLPGLLGFGALKLGERLAIIRAFTGMMLSSRRGLTEAGRGSIKDWLERRRQPEGAVRRFWDPILVSAVNESLERASALPCLQVFLQGFLPHRDAARMGVPRMGLSELYGAPAVAYLEARGGEVRMRTKVEGIRAEGGRAVGVRLADGEEIPAASVIVAVPPESLGSLAGANGNALVDTSRLAFEHSPITGIHLWFDREVFDLPHAVLLDSVVQWVFPKSIDTDLARSLGAKQRLQLVVSASRVLQDRRQADILDLAREDLARAFPAVRDATVLKGVVVKENRATISVTPELESMRPDATTAFENVFLAGDWTRTGWPATLEGATRSGRIAAAHALGTPPALEPDLPRSWLARMLMARVPQDWPTP